MVCYNIIVGNFGDQDYTLKIIIVLTKYPKIGANIVNVNDAIPIMTPVSSEEAPLSLA